MSSFPIRYAHGNVLVGPGSSRAALYRLETVSYRFLPRRDKELWFRRLAQFAYGVEANFSLWRVNRAYPVVRYLASAEELVDKRHAEARLWAEFVAGHAEAVRSLQSHVPEIYLAIELSESERSRPSAIGAAASAAARRVERVAGVGRPRPLPRLEIDALRVAEERAFGQLNAHLPAVRATIRELEWLLRRAPLRAMAEPLPERWWQPSALIVKPEGQELRFEPLETDFMRLPAARTEERERMLVLETEAGRSFQAFLALGALPEEVAFPGARAELLSAPLEALDFPVDIAMHVHWIGNRDASTRVRRRILDADDVYAEESERERGATWSADDNRSLARELHAYLESEARPPLLHAAISFGVSGTSAEEVDQRIELLRARYGSVALHRPLGLQPALYADHFPRPDAGSVWDYSEYLTVEQFGALMPIATHEVGPRDGVYLGWTSGGTSRPVLFDTSAAAKESRPPSILLAGTLGSGKTIAAELLAIQAALRGALVVDVDPKPDHRLDTVPVLEGLVRVIELSGDESNRGHLDPLRIAPPSLREDLASSFFSELLPQGPPSWETHIRRAVRDVLRVGHASSEAVLDLLMRSASPDARDAGDALSVWADSGLGRLAVGSWDPAEEVPMFPITTIRAGTLSLPSPETPRSDYTPSERLSTAILKLVAAYALRRVSGDRSRAKLLLFDEAWLLLSSSEGRRLLDRLNRLGRAENATLLLATQQLADVGDLENLIGARFIFGQESVAEAERALSLLGLDPSDRDLVQRVRSYRRGRCLLRDLDDRIAEVQIDTADPELLAILDTTPGRRAEVVA